ncbi:MAG: hypothetical protein IPK26_11870 [Planctomycetes bacterium]|nr:hypothetical protein [Planctomycetota bacterium]
MRSLTLAVVPFLLLVSTLAWNKAPQDPTPVPWLELAERAGAGAGEPTRLATEQLAAAIERDYAGAHTAWRTATGRVKVTLQHMLRLPAIDAADIIVRGKVVGADATQGGVIDYHWVHLHLDAVKLVRAPADDRERITQDHSVRVLAGTSHDWWLGDLLIRDLRGKIGAERTFVLKARPMQHANGDQRAVTIFEYFNLPAGAADCISG